MNYSRIYAELVQRAKSQAEARRSSSDYYEEHHVIPRCVNPSSSFTVPLTAREHILAHHLLAKFFPTSGLLRASALMGVRRDAPVSLIALSRQRLSKFSWTKTEEGRQCLKQIANRLAHEGRNGFQSEKSREFSRAHSKDLQRKWKEEGNHPLSSKAAREVASLKATERNKQMNAELNKLKAQVVRTCERCGAIVKGPLGNMKQHQRSSKCIKID